MLTCPRACVSWTAVFYSFVSFLKVKEADQGERAKSSYGNERKTKLKY